MLDLDHAAEGVMAATLAPATAQSVVAASPTAPAPGLFATPNLEMASANFAMSAGSAVHSAIELLDPVNAAILDGQATVMILDDDGAGRVAELPAAGSTTPEALTLADVESPVVERQVAAPVEQMIVEVRSVDEALSTAFSAAIRGLPALGEVGLLRGVEMTLRAPLGASGPGQPAPAIDLWLLLTLLVLALGARRTPHAVAPSRREPLRYGLGHLRHAPWPAAGYYRRSEPANISSPGRAGGSHGVFVRRR
jgi:hypothetical protein